MERWVIPTSIFLQWQFNMNKRYNIGLCTIYWKPVYLKVWKLSKQFTWSLLRHLTHSLVVFFFKNWKKQRAWLMRGMYCSTPSQCVMATFDVPEHFFTGFTVLILLEHATTLLSDYLTTTILAWHVYSNVPLSCFANIFLSFRGSVLVRPSRT